MKKTTEYSKQATIVQNQKETANQIKSNFNFQLFLRSKLRPLILPRRLYPKLHPFKRFIGCKSYDKVIVNGEQLIVRGYEFSYHSLFHYEISLLPRIRFGKDWVSGIHGFNTPMFHDELIEVEYDGGFDEARVAIHEWLTRTSAFNSMKLLNWMAWLALVGINPIAIIISHAKSIKNYQGELSTDFPKQDRINAYRVLEKLRVF